MYVYQVKFRDPITQLSCTCGLRAKVALYGFGSTYATAMLIKKCLQYEKKENHYSQSLLYENSFFRVVWGSHRLHYTAHLCVSLHLVHI